MIEVRMERVIDVYGNMALKIRELRGLSRGDLPINYVDSTDIRCWLGTRGDNISIDVVGVKNQHLPSPWDTDDDARQLYLMDSCYLMESHILGYPTIVAILGFMYEAGCNLMISRNPADLFEPDPGIDIWKMELLLHLSPTKNGVFEKNTWKGLVTVRI